MLSWHFDFVIVRYTLYLVSVIRWKREMSACFVETENRYEFSKANGNIIYFFNCIIISQPKSTSPTQWLLEGDCLSIDILIFARTPKNVCIIYHLGISIYDSASDLSVMEVTAYTLSTMAILHRKQHSFLSCGAIYVYSVSSEDAHRIPDKVFSL